jgi:hypothetical protein
MRQQASIICCVLAGCSFQAPEQGAGVDGSSDPMIDGARSIDAPPPAIDGAIPVDAPPAQVLCTTSDGALKLCLEFEDPTLGIALDGAGGSHDAIVTAATATTRDIPTTSRAIGLGATSSVMIPDSAAFDLQTVTLSAWIQRSALPASGRSYGVIDLGRRQASLSIDDTGHAVCAVKTDTTLWFRSGGTTAVNEWALAACTYNAPTLCTYVWRNGNPTASVTCGTTDGEPLDTSTNAGEAIGALLDTSNNPSSRFTGKLDAVRVYGRELTETELCTAGGLSGC